MTTQERIMLRVSGTKVRSAGFAPLINIGVLPAELSDSLDKVSLIGEKPTYIISHQSTYIYYGLVDGSVKSMGADTSGVLSIALVIPKGFKLCDNKSPYTILSDIYQKFLSDYMNPLSDGRDEFLDKEIDQEVFREILSEYSLEENKLPYITMKSQGLIGTLRVTPDKIEELFRDSQYKEFAEFKEIEVGLNCANSPQLESIQIPRPVNYSLFINGDDSGRVITDMSELIDVNIPATSTYEYTPTSFTLYDVLSAPNYRLTTKANAEVTAYPASNRIECKLRKTEIQYDVNWAFNCDNDIREKVEEALKAGKIFIKIGGSVISPLTTKTVPVSLVKGQSTVEPARLGDYQLRCSNYAPSHERILKITISATRKPASVPKPIARPVPNPTIKELEEQDSILLGKNKKIIKILIALFIAFVLGVLVGVGGTLGVQKILPKIHKEEAPVEEVEADVVIYKPSADENHASSAIEGNNESDEQDSQNVTEQVENQLSEKDEERIKQEEEAVARQRDEDRSEILKLVRRQVNVSKCRSHTGWSSLSQQERIGIEAILQIDSVYKPQVSPQGKKLLNDLKSKIPDIKNYDDIENMRRSIENIVANNKKKL
jgi:DNA-directed RNA polymerase subunit H (RpoH/RPB5)